MAHHAPKRLIYLRLDAAHAPQLAACYSWKHLQIATQENFVWVKNISDKGLNTGAIRAIPSLLVLEGLGDVLYPYGKQLVWGELPKLTWQGIQQAFELILPPINAQVAAPLAPFQPKLVQSHAPQAATALRVLLQEVEAWAKGAAAWRLNALQWLLVAAPNQPASALVLGQPLPPLNGQAYWTCGACLLPLGHAFEHEAWEPLLQQYIGEKQDWLWHKDGSYAPLAKALWQPLSRSSLQQTRALLDDHFYQPQ